MFNNSRIKDLEERVDNHFEHMRILERQINRITLSVAGINKILDYEYGKLNLEGREQLYPDISEKSILETIEERLSKLELATFPKKNCPKCKQEVK